MTYNKITKKPTMLGMEDRIPLGNFKGKKVKELVKQKDLKKKERSHYRTYRQVQIHFRI